MNRRKLLAALIAAPVAAVASTGTNLDGSALHVKGTPERDALCEFHASLRGKTNRVRFHDARGASDDFVKRLPEILRANNERLEARIISRMKTGRYD